MNNEFKLVRIDSRMIHAQIIMIWTKRLNITKLFVVNDEISNNPYISQVYKLMNTNNLKIETFTVDQMISYYEESKLKNSKLNRSMVLAKDFETIIMLLNKGMEFREIQWGTNYSEEGLSKAEYIDFIRTNYKEELVLLDEKLIQIYYQNAIEDSKEPINHVKINKKLIWNK